MDGTNLLVYSRVYPDEHIYVLNRSFVSILPSLSGLQFYMLLFIHQFYQVKTAYL